MGCNDSRLSPQGWEGLRRSKYFEGTAAADIKKIVNLGYMLDMDPGQQVFGKGDFADSFYLILSGEVAIVAGGQIIKKWGVGEGFGEEALLMDGEMLRLASATCTRECELLELERETFLASRAKPFMTQFARKIDSVNLIRKIRFLRSVPFLQEAYVPDAQMQAVASLFEYQVYDFDETVCEEEEATSAFYIVCSGHVGSFMSLHGFEVHLNDLKTGDYTGEVALVERMHNIITLRAFNRSTLLELPVTKFDKLLEISAGMRQYLSLHGRQRTASALRRYQVPFFDSLSDHSMERLATLCRLRQCKKGERICKAGDMGDAFFIVSRGSLDVLRPGKGVVRTLGPGDYFGEISLVADQPRSATVTAVDPATVLLEIGKDDFLTIFSHEPAALAEIEIKVLGPDVQLYSILNHVMASEYLVRHLQKEFASENIEFWRAADRFYKLHASLENSRSKIHTAMQSSQEEAGEAGRLSGRNGRRDKRRTILNQRAMGSARGIISAEAAETENEGFLSNPVAFTERKLLRVLAKRRTEALTIYNRFITEGSEKEVNIRDATKQAIKDKVANEQFPVDLFLQAQEEIYSLMSRDNYQRFHRSPLFAQMLRDLNVYNPEMHRSPDTPELSIHSQRSSQPSDLKHPAVAAAVEEAARAAEQEEADGGTNTVASSAPGASEDVSTALDQ